MTIITITREHAADEQNNMFGGRVTQTMKTMEFDRTLTRGELDEVVCSVNGAGWSVEDIDDTEDLKGRA